MSLQQLRSSLDLCVDFRHTKTTRRCHCRTPRGHGSHSGSGPQADAGTHADGVVPPQLNNIGLAGGGALGKAAP